MNPNRERGLVLMNQGRYAQAEAELRLALANDSQDAFLHACLALCLAELDRLQEAEEEAGQSIALEPDIGFHHYAMANVLRKRNRPKECRDAIREAIRLEPRVAAWHCVLGAVELELKNPEAALAAANTGLTIDPEDSSCANLRIMALARLGRIAEAGEAMKSVLADDPENPDTHANMGWTLLQSGEHKQAFEHFREALRLEPGLEHARLGILEAMKSRNVVYRWLLRYFFWISRFRGGTQMAIIIGLFFLYRSLDSFAKENPWAAPFIWPLLVGYAVFALSSWLGNPLMNLLLLSDRFGRWALSADEKRGALLVSGFLAASVAAFAAGLMQGEDGNLTLESALLLALTTLPASKIFECAAGWPRIALCAIVGVLLVLASIPVAVYWLFSSNRIDFESARRLYRLSNVWFVNGFIGSQFAAMYLGSVRLRR